MDENANRIQQCAKSINDWMLQLATHEWIKATFEGDPALHCSWRTASDGRVALMSYQFDNDIELEFGVTDVAIVDLRLVAAVCVVGPEGMVVCRVKDDTGRIRYAGLTQELFNKYVNHRLNELVRPPFEIERLSSSIDRIVIETSSKVHRAAPHPLTEDEARRELVSKVIQTEDVSTYADSDVAWAKMVVSILIYLDRIEERMTHTVDNAKGLTNERCRIKESVKAPTE